MNNFSSNIVFELSTKTRWWSPTHSKEIFTKDTGEHQQKTSAKTGHLVIFQKKHQPHSTDSPQPNTTPIWGSRYPKVAKSNCGDGKGDFFGLVS